MDGDPTAIVAGQLRALLEAGGVAGLADGQLLERFVGRDGPAAEAAFAALVARHGPMVLAVCRRVLGDEHAAEDAFQATFLVLARRAASVRVRDSLGPWLAGVADRTARKARTAAARRAARERKAAVPEAGAASPPADDLRPVVLAEVQRLPARYRAAVVLCYLQGRTHDQAAAELGWPVGTVRGRLARARDLLRARLARRGLAPAAALACLAESTADAHVPAALGEAAVGLATRRAPVAASVALLARQITRSLLMAKLKAAAIAALALVLLAGAGLAAMLAARGPRRPAPIPVAVQRPAAEADPLPAGARVRLGSSLFHTGGSINQVLYARDGRLLVTVDWTHAVRVWDAATGRLDRTLGEPSIDFRAIALAPGGATLAAGASTPGPRGGFALASISLWDVARRAKMREMLAHQQWVASLSFAPDGRTLASSGTEPTVRLWDVATGRDAFPRPGHRSQINAMVVSQADGTVYTAGYDGTVRRWDPANGRELGIVVDIGTPIARLALAPDGKTFVATDTFHSPIQLRDVATGRVIRALKWRDYQRFFGSPAFSPDSKTIAAGDGVWDVATGEYVRHFDRGEKQSINALNYTSDSTRLIATDADGVGLWDIATGKEVRRLLRVGRLQGNKTVSPDGRLLARGGYGGEYRGAPVDPPIRVYELDSGEEALTLGGIEGRTHGLAFSPDGRLLATGHGDQSAPRWAIVIVWDIATGAELRRLEGHRGAVRSVAFSPDGRTLVSSSADGTALAWDVADLAARRPALGDDWAALRDDLAGEDARRAYRASWALADDRAIPYLRDHLGPDAAAEGPESLRPNRAIAALERNGSAGARAILERLAGGAEGARPTAEAREAIHRLKKR